jgi:thiol-disulfide isomerase/thioredoxin
VSGAARVAAVAVALTLAAPARPDEPRLRPWTRGETPALSGAGLAGRKVDLRALHGKVVLVSFWASWCEPCEAELPALQRLRARLAARPLEVVTVNYGEGAARAERFLRDLAVDVPVLLDPEHRAAEAWGVGGLPMSFLVDADGRVRSWVFGECDWTVGEAADALDRLLVEAERTRSAMAPRGGDARPAAR